MTNNHIRCEQGLRSKDGVILRDGKDILERWAEYVQELYHDDRDESMDTTATQETCTVTEIEVKSAVQKLAKNKAVGEDNIPAEFLQNIGENGIAVITKLMNNIYRTGKIPEDFTNNVFIPLPKVQGAQDCNDFRTISLVSHTQYPRYCYN